MKKMRFEVPLYYVKVTLIQVESPDDADDVAKECKAFGLDSDSVDEEKNEAEKCVNGGRTYRHLENSKMLVIFARFTSNKMKYNVFSHEKRHIEDRILEHASVDDIESAAFLAGFLGEKFHEFDLLTTN